MDWGNRNQERHRHRHRGGDREGKGKNHRQQRSLMSLAKAQVGDRLWIAGYESSVMAVLLALPTLWNFMNG